LGILFFYFLCSYPYYRNLCNLIVSVIVGLLTTAYIYLLVNILQFSLSLLHTGPKIFLYTFISKMFIWFLSLFVSIKFSAAHVNVFFIIVFFSLNLFFEICLYF
jgi:hypothetical protein